MRQYSIDQVEVSWQGLSFKEGLAAGTSITEARNAPSFTQKVNGAVSRVVRVFNPDKSGTITIVVDQESNLHQQLRALAAADEISRAIVGPMTVRDNSNDETLVYTNCYISTQPNETRGTDSATFEWVFNFESFAKAPALGNANSVGN